MRKSIVMFLLLVMVTPVLAQDGPELQCTLEDVTAVMTTAQEMLTEALGETDLVAAFDALGEVEVVMRTTRAACQGMYWEGRANDVLLPPELEAGVYIMEYTIYIDPDERGGNVISRVERVDGEDRVSGLNEIIRDSPHTGRIAVNVEGGQYLLEIEAEPEMTWEILLYKPS